MGPTVALASAPGRWLNGCMGSLKDKLARLGSPTGARPESGYVPASRSEPEPDEAPTADPHEAGATDEEPRREDPRGVAEALRLEIARILAKPLVKRVAHHPNEGELPFVRIETETGPLYRRILHYGAAHRVGRFSVQDGASADMDMIALLALDPGLAGIDPRGLLYVDTETTGLAGGTGTVPFLVGAAYFEEGTLVLEQLLLRQLGEETPILQRFHELVARSTGFVSYNGKSFDLPLLRTRLVLSRLPPLPEKPHVDLVHLARRVHGKRLGACKLTTVEDKVLGFVREGDIPGGEVVQRFRHFLRTGDEGALVAVVDHNAWDIVALASLLGLYGAPLGSMHAADLVGVSRTLRRSRDYEAASAIAEAAVSEGGGAEALVERAEVLRARGERDRAILDLEAALTQVDDREARLSLAKLFEHHARAPEAALALLAQPTNEGDEAHRHRVARLEKKVGKQQRLALGEGRSAPRNRRKAAKNG